MQRIIDELMNRRIEMEIFCIRPIMKYEAPSGGRNSSGRNKNG